MANKNKTKDTSLQVKVFENKRGPGNPPKYGSEEELRLVIADYFRFCNFKENGRPRLSPLMPNKAGLCLYLGISRDTYSEYRKKYPDTIKGADDLIEDAWIQRLKSSSPIGAIFYLKNAFKEEYKDRHETDITSKGKAVGNAISFTDFSQRKPAH